MGYEHRAMLLSLCGLCGVLIIISYQLSGSGTGTHQGCDSRTRGNPAQGLKNSLRAVFARYLRGNHVRCIYGNVVKSEKFNTSKAIGDIADTNIARKMISQSRHTPVPYLHVTVNAFPPRNRARALVSFLLWLPPWRWPWFLS